MKIIKLFYFAAMVWSSSLLGANYYFTGNVSNDLDRSTEYAAFTYTSGQMDGYNSGDYDSIVWYNLGTNGGDDTTYGDTDLLGDYSGAWSHSSPASGQNFVSLDSTVGNATVDRWYSIGGKAVSFNSTITSGEDYYTIWGDHLALRIGNGTNSATVGFNGIYLWGDRNSILSVSNSATLNASTLTMDGSNHSSSSNNNPHMLFHVSGTANVGTLNLGSTDTGVGPSESMVHIGSTGELKVDTLNYNADDYKTAVIMLDHQGILKITNTSTGIKDAITAYRDAGGIFSNSVYDVNVFEYENDLYVTTLELSQIPEPAHVTLVMGLFALLYLPLSARKVAI